MGRSPETPTPPSAFADEYTPEYADMPIKDAMRALVGDWHDANEAACCDHDGPPYCEASKAYAHGYLAALAECGF